VLPGPARAVQNLASQVLSRSTRRLGADFQALYGHTVLLAETFVDPERFRGTCYLACNWIQAGETAGWSRRGTTWWQHGRRKLVFLLPLHRRAHEWLAAGDSPCDPTANRGGLWMVNVAQLPIEGQDGLLEVLAGMTDPRMRRGRRYSVVTVLAQALMAVLSGCRSYAAIAQYVEDMDGALRVRLRGSRWRGPSESTFRRVLSRLDARELDRRVGAWLSRHRDVTGAGIAIDGKSMRGSRDGSQPPVHLVSAVLHQDGAVLSQTRVPDKTNEIRSVVPLLDDVEIQGAVVTGDAMYAQKEIARYIVEEKRADYLFTVKDNQPTLRSRIESMDLESFSPSLQV
jgi:hypothetical protein